MDLLPIWLADWWLVGATVELWRCEPYGCVALLPWRRGGATRPCGYSGKEEHKE